MADILKPVNGEFSKRYEDMGDGTHAEVVVIGGMPEVQVNGADISPTNPLPTGMYRSTVVRTVTIANGASLSDAFDMRGYAIAYIEIPGTWTAANLGIVSAEALAGTYQAVGARDRYGTRDVISGIQTSELCLYEAPPAWAGAHFAKLISLNTGTGAAENQGGDRTIRVFLKS